MIRCIHKEVKISSPSREMTLAEYIVITNAFTECLKKLGDDEESIKDTLQFAIKSATDEKEFKKVEDLIGLMERMGM